MKLYVGVTDADWFRHLRDRKAEEMNFWRPKATSQFRILEPSELFLFKTRFPENKIVGGAFFVRHTTLPLDLAWKAFGEANGMPSLHLFRAKIQSLRPDQERNPALDAQCLRSHSTWRRAFIWIHLRTGRPISLPEKAMQSRRALKA